MGNTRKKIIITILVVIALIGVTAVIFGVVKSKKENNDISNSKVEPADPGMPKMETPTGGEMQQTN